MTGKMPVPPMRLLSRVPRDFTPRNDREDPPRKLPCEGTLVLKTAVNEGKGMSHEVLDKPGWRKVSSSFGGGL